MKLQLVIVGPSADYITGSLLRPLNIWYALKSLKHVNVSYVPVRTICQLLFSRHALKQIINADIVIISGVNPWVTAFIVILRRSVKRMTLTDVHGFAWYELTLSKSSNQLHRVILFVAELFAYKSSPYLITASDWLAEQLHSYFSVDRRKVYTIENTLTPIFENIVKRLREYNAESLRRIICSKVLARKCPSKYLIVAPLPEVFVSNIFAFRKLCELAMKFPKNVTVVVTGVKNTCRISGVNIVCTGYLPYPVYVALLLSSDAVILPYPENAICGGVRNKVLEALYVGKLIISSKTGLLHLSLNRSVQRYFITLEEFLKLGVSSILTSLTSRNELFKNSGGLVVSKYDFNAFRSRFLKFMLAQIMTYRSNAWARVNEL